MRAMNAFHLVAVNVLYGIGLGFLMGFFYPVLWGKLVRLYYRWLNAWRDSGMLAWNVHTGDAAPSDMTEILGPAEECRPVRLSFVGRLIYSVGVMRIKLPEQPR